LNHNESERLIDSEDAGKVADGLSWLKDNAEANPDDSGTRFQYGGGLDSSGDEAGAMAA
jgi:hypothetical protein